MAKEIKFGAEAEPFIGGGVNQFADTVKSNTGTERKKCSLG